MDSLVTPNLELSGLLGLHGLVVAISHIESLSIAAREIMAACHLSLLLRSANGESALHAPLPGLGLGEGCVR